jgi:SAM-dependent methyltransferase
MGWPRLGNHQHDKRLTQNVHQQTAPTPLGGLRTYWDRINERRWGQYLSNLEERTVQQALDFYLTPGTVVDIGCGSGRWSAMAVKAGWRPICLDVDREILSVCQHHVSNADCRLLDPDWTTLPITTGSTQAVFCVEVFTLMGQERLTKEVNRVLAPGGIFVGVFGNLLSWRGLLAQLPLKGAEQRTYYPRSYGSWRREIKGLGFEFLHEEGYGWGPFSRGSNSPLIPLSIQFEQHFGLRRCKLVSPWVIFIARKR